MYVRLLMNEIFGKENFRNEIVVRKVNYQGINVQGRFNPAHDLCYFYNKASGRAYFNIVFRERGREVNWVNAVSPKENKEQVIIYIGGREFIAPKGHHWRFSQDRFNKLYSEGRIRIKEDYEYIDVFGNKQRGIPQYLESELTPVDSNWTDIPGYSFGWHFQTENSEILLKRVIESTSNEGDLVMDFFLGSGTTTAVAHKLRRKWIGIEMGEHFWTVIMPRMKKVLAYDKSGISKEKDVKEKYNEKTAGGFFKYQILEQYEDALDNIELQENQSAQKVFKDDYLIKYFLDYETRESPYLLNFQHLKNPFNYKLKINLSEVGEPQETNIDIPETFNYLLGIKIKKIKKEQNEGKTYLFIIGEKDSKDYAIVWREHADNWNEEDYKKDKEFIKQQLKPYKPQVVYVNCSSILTPNFDDYKAEIRYIEPEFKALMES
jgi:adenine-specific DNA-methyltransferase